MARLHEYQGKAILAANGFKIPRGRAVLSADDAVVAAKELGGEVVIKIQAWTTGRAGIGGVAFAKGPDDVRAHAEQMLSMKSVSSQSKRCCSKRRSISIASFFFHSPSMMLRGRQ